MEQEKQWISEIKKENKEAFKAVYDYYASKIYYTALQLYLSHEEAQEMVQNVFLKLWEKREGLKEHLSLNAYLLTITKNKILNLHKRKAIELVSTRSYIQYQDQTSSCTNDDILFDDLERHTLCFIDSLPARHRQIFLLSRKEGLKNDEIADQLHLSKRTVENNIYQAEIAIRRFLKNNKLLERSLVFLIACLSI